MKHKSRQFFPLLFSLVPLSVGIVFGYYFRDHNGKELMTPQAFVGLALVVAFLGMISILADNKRSGHLNSDTVIGTIIALVTLAAGGFLCFLGGLERSGLLFVSIAGLILLFGVQLKIVFWVAQRLQMPTLDTPTPDDTDEYYPDDGDEYESEVYDVDADDGVDTPDSDETPQGLSVFDDDTTERHLSPA